MKTEKVRISNLGPEDEDTFHEDLSPIDAQVDLVLADKALTSLRSSGHPSVKKTRSSCLRLKLRPVLMT